MMVRLFYRQPPETVGASHPFPVFTDTDRSGVLEAYVLFS